MEHIDAVFQGTPELAGLKAIAVMQRLVGHPGVAVLQDTRTSTNVMLITVEQTAEALGIAARRRGRPCRSMTVFFWTIPFPPCINH